MNISERIVFALYKDKPLINSNVFKRETSKYKNIDVKKLYIEITNYQIKKYGCSLQRSELKTNDDARIIHRNARQREYYWRNKW